MAQIIGIKVENYKLPLNKNYLNLLKILIKTTNNQRKDIDDFHHENTGLRLLKCPNFPPYTI